jgi:hypothetical protein
MIDPECTRSDHLGYLALQLVCVKIARAAFNLSVLCVKITCWAGERGR